MKRIVAIFSLLIVGLMMLSCYDDSALYNTVKDLEQRIKTIEERCNQMNTNITSLQNLINSIQKGCYITDVKPLTENRVEVGYTITLSDGSVINIYHGEDSSAGENGATPELGVKQDADGEYYWMVGGEWLTDAAGNKIPVTPEDGKDGITPKMKIENDTWYVSYDNGATWSELGKSVPEDFCLFKDVTYKDGILTFTFADGNVLTLNVGGKMKIVLGEYDPDWGNKLEIPYTIEGAIGEVMIFATTDLLDGDHEIWVKEIVEETSNTGVIKVNVGWWDDKEYHGKLAIFAVDETGTTVSKIVRLTTGVLEMEDNDTPFVLDADATNFDVTISTNRKIQVNTNVDWITYVKTKAVTEKTLVFDVQKNENTTRRRTEIEIISGDRTITFPVSQKAGGDTQYSVTMEYNEVTGGYPYVCLNGTMGVTINGTHYTLEAIRNRNGQTVDQALGYDSWNDFLTALGARQTQSNFAGDVIVTAYDLETGESYGKVDYVDPYCPSYYFTKEGRITNDYNECCIRFYYDSTERFTFDIYNYTAGESYLCGIMLSNKDAEVRVEVTINVTEYVDPEAGKYNNPSQPGRYEFDIKDRLEVIDMDPDINSKSTIKNTEVYEKIKTILGMTTYEMFNSTSDFAYYYQLKDGSIVNDDSYSLYYLDKYSNITSIYDQRVLRVLWNKGPIPQYNYSYCVFQKLGNNWRPAVIEAAEENAVIEYKYVIKYKDYELVFNHRIELVKADYDDPEAGKYVNPEVPGKYEFDIKDEIILPNKRMTIDEIRASAEIHKYDVWETIRQVLGMTSYEVCKNQSNITGYFVLDDGSTVESSYLRFDSEGNYVSDYNLSAFGIDSY